jgi:hypothetical protein
MTALLSKRLTVVVLLVHTRLVPLSSVLLNQILVWMIHQVLSNKNALLNHLAAWMTPPELSIKYHVLLTQVNKSALMALIQCKSVLTL